jgi:hypothetical protein
VAVNAKAAWAAEGLVAGLADVAVLALGEGASMRRVHVVMVVLPRVGAWGSHRDGKRRRKRLGQWSLVVKSGYLGLWLGLGVCRSVISAHGRLARIRGGSRSVGGLLGVGWSRHTARGQLMPLLLYLQGGSRLVPMGRLGRGVGELAHRLAGR